jgi:hypothetical protein
MIGNGGCTRCKRKRVLLLFQVRRRPIQIYDRETRRYRTDPTQSPHRIVWPICADEAECRAYQQDRYRKQREASEKRGGRLVLREAPAAGKPFEKGVCCWCGEAIILADPTDYRRRARTRHYGDEHEVGDRNCTAEFLASYANNARELIEKRGDPVCVDCGSEDSWDAEHDVPLWDGGEHSPDNIVRRCGDCHRRKTKAEAAERARRRSESTQPRLAIS